MPANRYLHPREPGAALGTADAGRKFNHALHAKILERERVSCADRHRFDANIDSGTEPVAGAPLGAAQYLGSSACHFCHGWVW
jgi:hypothetical protein